MTGHRSHRPRANASASPSSRNLTLFDAHSVSPTNKMSTRVTARSSPGRGRLLRGGHDVRGFASVSAACTLRGNDIVRILPPTAGVSGRGRTGESQRAPDQSDGRCAHFLTRYAHIVTVTPD